MTEISRPAQAGALADAAASANYDKAIELLNAGADPNDVDYRGQEAILIASSSDQFRLVKSLMDHGANIWATTKLGHCVGSFTFDSRVNPDTDEGRAHKDVVATLIAAGYPPPPLYSEDVQNLIENGKWPPEGAKDVIGNTIKR